MAQCRWAREGTEVNYSITGWLRQELFKQGPVSRGLGLITPAKAMPRTLPPALRCLWFRRAREYSYLPRGREREIERANERREVGRSG